MFKSIKKYIEDEKPDIKKLHIYDKALIALTFIICCLVLILMIWGGK